MIDCALLTLQTPYFLITDADTFFMREMEALDLMDQQDCTPSSSICDLQKRVGQQPMWMLDFLSCQFQLACTMSAHQRNCQLDPCSLDTASVRQTPYRCRILRWKFTCSTTCGRCMDVQVQFRARNELQKPVQWADQQEWIKLSAQVLNVSSFPPLHPVCDTRTQSLASLNLLLHNKRSRLALLRRVAVPRGNPLAAKASCHPLQISAPEHTLQTPGVTPQILSRAVIDPMVTHLEAKVRICWRCQH